MRSILFQMLSDEHGLIIWDVLVAVIMIALFVPVLVAVSIGVKHGYDRVEHQLEATEQVQLFLTQLREDVGKSISIQLQNSSAVELKEYDGKKINLYYNPTAHHIVRLVNGNGGEIACLYVNSVTFQTIGRSELHIALEVMSTSPSHHFEDSIVSLVS